MCYNYYNYNENWHGGLFTLTLLWIIFTVGYGLGLGLFLVPYIKENTLRTAPYLITVGICWCTMGLIYIIYTISYFCAIAECIWNYKIMKRNLNRGIIV